MDVFAEQGKVRAIYHVSVGVSDIEGARRFYSAVPCAPGYKLLQFYAAALAAGGSDNGPPGYRLDCDPGYYGAFVLDPDRNKLEAMWFDHHRARNEGTPRQRWLL